MKRIIELEKINIESIPSRVNSFRQSLPHLSLLEREKGLEYWKNQC